MSEHRVGTLISCMDYRVWPVAAEFMIKTFGLDGVDLPTEAGPDGIFGIGIRTCPNFKRVLDLCQISIDAHGSQTIALVGHQLCAGNPVEDSAHQEQVATGIKVIRMSIEKVQRVLGIWVEVEPEATRGKVIKTCETQDNGSLSWYTW